MKIYRIFRPFSLCIGVLLIVAVCVLGQDSPAGCDVTDCGNGGSCVTTADGVSCACQQHFTGDHCQSVVFPSGLSFAVVNEDELDAATAGSYQDVLNTGSSLLNISVVERDLRLSLNTAAGQFMYEDESYFRIHPTVVQCLQRVITYMKNREGIDVRILRGYLPHSQVNGGFIVDNYAAAGTGVIVTSPASPDTETLMKIVDASLMFCATDLFSSERRYLGVVLMGESVHVHMTAQGDTAPHFSVHGNPDYTDAAFQTHCQDKINQVLAPVREARCRNVTVLESGDVYPTGAVSPESVVGSSDSDHADSSDYFQNLVVYPGSDVGVSGRILMAPRMYDVIRKLQHYVTTNTSNADSLRIIRLHDDTGPGLHVESRAAEIKLASDDASLLGLLSLFAMCSGADYVRHDDTSIYVAVKKQSTIRARNAEVTFENSAALLAVNPPQQSAQIHLVGEEGNFPIFDSDYQVEELVGVETILGIFASESSRYLRLDPVIAGCYDKLVLYDQKWNDGVLVPISVVRGYMSRQDFAANTPDAMEMAHLKGVAMVIRYGDNVTAGEFAASNGLEFTMRRLGENAVKICGALFNEKKQQYIGVQVSAEGVYIDLRDDFWFDIEESFLPVNVSEGTYEASMEELFANALDGRVVNPELPVKACQRDHAPKVKSVDFRYEHPAHIARRRRRRQVGEGEEDQGCVPTRDTAFCRQTQPHREAQIEHLWKQFSRKHFYHDEQELRHALEGCFGDCGTCLLGEVYEDKTEHCSNLLHWLPFELMNEAENSTHLYDTRSSAMKRHACLGDGYQCIFNAPLYAILATTIEMLYRPDPRQSVEEQLYGATYNPLPIYEILYPMFAINARGSVTVWVASKEEINSIRSALKAVMLYNRAVSHVILMLNSTSVENDVTAALESMIEDWTRTGCQLNSRPAIAPYTVRVIPEESHREKRSVAEDGFSFGEELIERQRHFEKHWAIKVRT